GTFDESSFVSFDTLAAMVSFCRASGAGSGRDAAAAAGLGENHADDKECAPDLKIGSGFCVPVELSLGAKVEDVRFAIAAVAEVKIVEGNSVLTSEVMWWT